MYVSADVLIICMYISSAVQIEVIKILTNMNVKMNTFVFCRIAMKQYYDMVFMFEDS